ncbi:hypothetical protein F9K50_11565 [bacterium]|nr:MAG: hypothetical protein F9K50_11565 [bacterium]
MSKPSTSPAAMRDWETDAMTRVLTLAEISEALPEIDVVTEIERGFVAFSQGKVEVPPVGELLFPETHGELHIKYGAVRGDDVFVVKLATGFFDNPKLGLPPFSGCMLVLSQKTGMVLSVLLEEGELTNHRTAAAGAVAGAAGAVSFFFSPRQAVLKVSSKIRGIRDFFEIIGASFRRLLKN